MDEDWRVWERRVSGAEKALREGNYAKLISEYGDVVAHWALFFSLVRDKDIEGIALALKKRGLPIEMEAFRGNGCWEDKALVLFSILRAALSKSHGHWISLEEALSQQKMLGNGSLILSLSGKVLKAKRSDVKA